MDKPTHEIVLPPNQTKYSETFSDAIKAIGVVWSEQRLPGKERFSTTATKRYAFNLLGVSTWVTATLYACHCVSVGEPMWTVYISLFVACSVCTFAFIYSFSGIIDEMISTTEMFFVWHAHIFNFTAAPIMWAIMHNRVDSTALLVIGLLCIIGLDIAELGAHTQDKWYFQKVSASQFGVLNLCFNVGLMSGFTFLAAAVWTTWWSISIAMLTPVLCIMSYGKGWRYALQTMSSLYTCWVLCNKLDSNWPIAYFFTAFPIIDTTLSLIKTEIQLFHMLPGIIAWCGFVVPLEMATSTSESEADATSIFEVMKLVVVFISICEFGNKILVPLMHTALKPSQDLNKGMDQQ